MRFSGEKLYIHTVCITQQYIIIEEDDDIDGDGYGDGRGGRSLPHPGGDGLVVEDDRSTTSDEHWLTILVDHVVVHSDEDEDYDNEENSKEKPVKDGKFAKASDCHSSHTCWNL